MANETQQVNERRVPRVVDANDNPLSRGIYKDIQDRHLFYIKDPIPQIGSFEFGRDSSILCKMNGKYIIVGKTPSFTCYYDVERDSKLNIVRATKERLDEELGYLRNKEKRLAKEIRFWESC